MIIAVDADGVLTDMSSYCLKMGEKYLRRTASNPQAYSWEEMFETSFREIVCYGIRIFIKYCKECAPRENAQSVIARLNQEGHVLYEVTARKFVTMRNPLGAYSRSMLLKWYEKHGFRFKQILFCSEQNTAVEKTESCLSIQAEIMIEDRPEVAKYLAENGITVLLFDAPYNQEVSGERIVRVRSWDEVYEWINSHC